MGKAEAELYAKLAKIAKEIVEGHAKSLSEAATDRRFRREQIRKDKRRETRLLRVLVDKVKTRMRENGERPPGGIGDAALDEVAEQHGLPSGAARKKRIQRHK